MNTMIDTYTRQVTMLASCGIQVPSWRIVGDEVSLREAVAQLHKPLVLKALPGFAQHKTEQGLVHLRLRDLDDVTRAARSSWSKLPSGAPLLVQEMVDDVVEMLLAVRSDADFGPIAAIGSGGVGVELLDEIAYLALPAMPAEFVQALRSLKSWRLLAGFRGQRPRDVDALALAASRLADWYLGAIGTTSELEINPLGVRASGEGVVALDVLEIPRAPVTATA